MALYNGSAETSPAAGNVLAHNGNSDRGWNDPPTLAFTSANSSAPRKRLDLRKRVGHNFVSGSNPLENKIENVSNHVMNLLERHLNARIELGSTETYQQPPKQPPGIHSQYPSFAPPTNPTSSVPFSPMQHSGVHNSIIPTGPPPSGPPPSGPPPRGPPPSGPNMHIPTQVTAGQPLSSSPSPVLGHHLVHASSMPNLLHGSPMLSPHAHNMSRQHSAIGKRDQPIWNPNLFGPAVSKGEPSNGEQQLTSQQDVPANTVQGSTPTTTSHVGQPLYYFSSQESHPAVANAVSAVTNELRSTPEIGSLGSKPEPVPCVPPAQSDNQQPDPLAVGDHEHSHHVRSTSMPNVNAVTPGETNLMAPPPMDGYYTKRAVSACSSRQRTPSPVIAPTPEQTENSKLDAESLNGALDKLNCTLEKCTLVADAKLLDDIRKRIAIFSQSWTEGKLSINVKLKMVQLSSALSDNQLESANAIHQALIVDYSNETYVLPNTECFPIAMLTRSKPPEELEIFILI
eukprot:gene6880-7655_t